MYPSSSYFFFYLKKMYVVFYGAKKILYVCKVAFPFKVILKIWIVIHSLSTFSNNLSCRGLCEYYVVTLRQINPFAFQSKLFTTKTSSKPLAGIVPPVLLCLSFKNGEK